MEFKKYNPFIVKPLPKPKAEPKPKDVVKPLPTPKTKLEAKGLRIKRN